MDKKINNIMNIDQLLDKYWAAETSLEEEQKLHIYFQSDNIAIEHQVFQSLFAVYHHASKVGLSRPFTKEALIPSRTRTKIFNLRSIGIAASILLALSVVYSSYKSNLETKSNIVVVNTPEEALAYTRNALALVSSSLEKGSQSMVKNMKPLRKANILN